MGASAGTTGKTEKFDMSKHIRFVPPFQVSEVDKYFLHFEKVASGLEWPKEVWTLLLQSTLISKAHEVYSAVSVNQSSDYEVIKGAILKAYHQGCCKGEQQTYVEFARFKENTGVVSRMLIKSLPSFVSQCC